MPGIESMRATVVLEFDLNTSLSKALTMVQVESLMDPLLNKQGESIGTRVHVRGIRVASMTIEPKHG